MVGKTYHGYICPPATEQAGVSDFIDFLRSLQETGHRIIKLYIAVRPQDGLSLALRQQKFLQSLCGLFTDTMPALTLVVQPPVGEHPFCAEIWSVPPSVTCRFSRWDGLPHVQIENDGVTELWTSGFTAEYPDRTDCSNRIARSDRLDKHPVQTAAENCFDRISGLLARTGFSYDHLFRQWNYIGHILETTSFQGKILQNYQIFNDIRAIYYSRKQDKSQYPAATGIGMEYPGICIDLVAVKELATDGKIRNIPLKSPTQKDAYLYTQQSLVGDSLLIQSESPGTSSGNTSAQTETVRQKNKTEKKAPLFERGRCFLSAQPDGLPASAMISGTASIKGEKTIAQNDIRKQTENTLNFIRDLRPRTDGTYRQHYTRARLYVKPGKDAREAIRTFTEYYPADCLRTVVQADICRESLLVEIEADLYYRKL